MKKPPDLSEIMHRLGRAIALVTVAYKRLDADDADTAASPECIVLQEGIAKLNEVYNELDAVEIRLSRR